MRELNPRAWIPSLNRYATGYDAIYYHCQMNNENGEWWCYPAGEIIQLDVEIELPTGLKDENGREIYDGDIVRWVNDYDENAYVSFDEGCFWVNWSINSERINGDMVDDLEVIGNIHENPELLGDINVTNMHDHHGWARKEKE